MALIAVLPSAIKRDMDKLAYRVYITDLLRGLAGGECARYADWIDSKPRKKSAPGEIAANVIRGAGLKVVI